MSPSISAGDSTPRDCNAAAREPTPADRASSSPGSGTRGASATGPGASRFAALLGAAGGDDGTGAAAGGVERRRGRGDDDGSAGGDADRGDGGSGGDPATQRALGSYDAAPRPQAQAQAQAQAEGPIAATEKGPPRGAPGLDPHVLGALQALSAGIVRSLRVGTVTTGSVGGAQKLGLERGARMERVVHMELGKGPWKDVQVRLQTRGREVDVRLCARDAAAADQARSAIDRLRAALEQRGVRVGQLDVRLESDGASTGDERPPGDDGDPGDSSRPEGTRPRGPRVRPPSEETSETPPAVRPTGRGEYMV